MVALEDETRRAATAVRAGKSRTHLGVVNPTINVVPRLLGGPAVAEQLGGRVRGGGGGE